MVWLKRWLMVAAVVAVVSLGLWFALDNPTRVPLNLFGLQLPEQSLALWLLLSLLLGMVLGYLLSMPRRVQLRAVLYRERHRRQQAEKELNSLRTGALKERL